MLFHEISVKIITCDFSIKYLDNQMAFSLVTIELDSVSEVVCSSHSVQVQGKGGEIFDQYEVVTAPYI